MSEAIAIVCVLSLMSFLPLSSAEGIEPRKITAKGVRPLEILNIDYREFSMKAASGEQITLEVMNTTISFALMPSSTWSEEVRVIGPSGDRDVAIESKLNEINAYRGVNLVNVDALRAFVTPTWMRLTFDCAGVEYFVDPIDVIGTDNYYALYTSSEVVWPTGKLHYDGRHQVDDTIENDGSDSLPVAAVPEPDMDVVLMDGGSGGALESRICEVVLVSDVEWRNDQPDDWVFYSLVALDDASERYETQVGITLRLKCILQAPEDECTSIDSDVLLDQLRTWMQGDHPDIERDLTFLCSGKNTDALGRARDIPGVGSLRFQADDDAYAYSEFSTVTFRNMFTMGHEIGHLFNAVHPYAHLTDNWIGRGELSWMFFGYAGEDDPDYISRADFTVHNANRIRSWGHQVLDPVLLRNPGPSPTTQDGLFVCDFSIESDEIWYDPDTVKTVKFRVVNTESSDFFIKQLSVRGARLGYSDDRIAATLNVVIPGNQGSNFEFEWDPIGTKEWTLSVYYLDSAYEETTFDLELVLTSYRDLAYVEGPDVHEDDDSWEDVCMFYRFYLLSTDAITIDGVDTDESVWTYFTLFSAQEGGEDDDYDCGDFAEFDDFHTRYVTPSYSSGTFGNTGEAALSLVSHSSIAGGGMTLLAESQILNHVGWWRFYPNFEFDGSRGPFDFNAISVYVYEPYVGPGCVAEGTLITMADGSKKPVETIKKGDSVLGYDPETGLFMDQTVLETSSAKVNQILDINAGALRVTLVDQPIYVMDLEGNEWWLKDPQDLEVGWKLLNAESGEWVEVVSLDIDTEKVKVYDFLTDGYQTYLGNSLLLMDKGKKG